MSDADNQDKQANLRTTLRTGGAICLGIGVLLAIVGLVDFFSAFGGDGAPTHFWVFFIALPLIGLGSAGTRAGYFGAAANWAARETAPALGTMRRAWDAGAPGAATTGGGFCTHCGAPIQAGNRFCGSCGAALAPDSGSVSP